MSIPDARLRVEAAAGIVAPQNTIISEEFGPVARFGPGATFNLYESGA